MVSAPFTWGDGRVHDFLGSLVVWPLESAVNQLIIGKDPHVRAAVGKFSGKSLAIVCREPAIDLTVQFDAQAVRIAALSADTLGVETDARVEGTLLSLLALLRQEVNSRPLADPAITLSGDVEFIQDLFQTLTHLDIHWSDYLAPVFGDMATNQATRVQSNLRAAFSDAGRRLRHDFDDYLKEGIGLTPHRSERQDFQDRLSDLRLQVDRIEARMAQIQSRLNTVND